HVHTTFSSDAFRMSLPMVQGEGAHPPADACDFARICAALDFWALTDHAESLTETQWNRSIDSVQQCNAVSGPAGNPDMLTFMGFEWTQAGTEPVNHYGHKNVIFKYDDREHLPVRPISSPFRAAFGSIPLKLRVLPPLMDLPDRQRYFDFGRLVRTVGDQPICDDGVHARDLPADCAEIAATPDHLFRKLREWDLDSIVIPHGNAWGIYSPAGTAWDKQLAGDMHDPERQILLEVYSGHGNSEEYRDFSAVTIAGDGTKTCPKPRPDYLPSCWQAGELIRKRCAAGGDDESECERRAALARDKYLEYGQLGWHTVPGTTLEDWLDAGQCRDCYQPAFNYRPKGSAQYALALRNFDSPDEQRRFRFGLMASSDNHTARPGTGYKESERQAMSDWWGYRDVAYRRRFSTDRGRPDPVSVDVDPSKLDVFNILELERQSSYFLTGGLVAIHSRGRDRETVWSAMQRKAVYGTSGQRTLLWFNLVNPPDGEDRELEMGAEVAMAENPRFQVRAVGAFEQLPGCPEHSMNALPADRLQRLCRGECYNPSAKRIGIQRIDVIKIRPQIVAGEDVVSLIEDPWQSFACDSNDGNGCSVEFEDPDFATSGRDTVYYVRALQAPQPAINAGGLRCEWDRQGRCARVQACYGDDRTDPDDDCLAESEGRAWSSPIFVDFAL
ncbi:MAG: DUF3604 domain-containing protein, partial [Gammaproteobacteria bacterium]|nr:DUF3604 domain-containing protein [Gammaproteobacteria bacterium]